MKDLRSIEAGLVEMTGLVHQRVKSNANELGVRPTSRSTVRRILLGQNTTVSNSIQVKLALDQLEKEGAITPAAQPADRQ